MQHVHARPLEPLRDVDLVTEGEAALGVLVARYSHVYYEVFAAALAHLADHVEGELQTSVDVSAVLIRALVVQGREEATQQAVRVRGVNLDAVGAGALHALGRVAELADYDFKLLARDGARRLAGIVGPDE